MHNDIMHNDILDEEAFHATADNKFKIYFPLQQYGGKLKCRTKKV